MKRRVAVVGGGLAGLVTAWQVRQGGGEVVVFEATGRVGGTVETVRRDGFLVEMGPDGWVTEKPWAAELAGELGLEMAGSLDAGRVTYILNGGRLLAMPDGMRMMVPTDLQALEGSELFTDAARAGYAAEIGRAEELRLGAARLHSSQGDESVAAFVRRHFGVEVLEKLAAPLLSGVFGGDVSTLSVRAVMPAFVAMEREFGSLIVGLRVRAREARGSVFTTLVGGMQGLVDGLAGGLDDVRLRTPVTGVAQGAGGWRVRTVGGEEVFQELVLATPAHATRGLLGRVSLRAAELLEMQATSAVLVGFGFGERFELPKGFGFLVPAHERCELLAGTFVDQKYAGRVPEGMRLVRGFFGGADGVRVAGMSDGEIAALALGELRGVLSVPEPLFAEVRRWPRSLPQYGVGHGERVLELDGVLGELAGLHLVGNAYRGVGVPDLVREGRALGRRLVG